MSPPYYNANMNADEFEKHMENLQKPGADSVKPSIDIKLAVVNPQRSAAIGVWFIAVPCYFLFCIFMKYYFHFNIGIFDIIVEMMSDLDKNPNMWFLSPLLIVVLPLVGVVLNALAITHFSYAPVSRILQISIKLRWMNVLVLLVSLSLVSIFILYAIIENIHHSQIK